MYIQRKRWRMGRRTFLRAAGVSLALPWLEAMGINSASVCNAGSINDTEIPRRVYFSNWGFFHAGEGMPKDVGQNYTVTPTLKPLEPYKGDCTVFSGMKAFNGGHYSAPCTLTGMNTPTNGMKLVSVDQQIADFYQGLTRVPSLALACAPNAGSLSFTRNKTPIRYEVSPRAIFDQLFRVEDAQQVKAHMNKVAHTNSILDRLKDQAAALEKNLGKDDRATLDQYFTSIRDLESKMQTDLAWLDRPKPDLKKLGVATPDFGKIPARPTFNNVGLEDSGFYEYTKVMFDMIVLAFQTDSTRVVTHNPKNEGGTVFRERTKCNSDYHILTHQMNVPAQLAFHVKVDTVYMELWAYFIGKLKSVKEGNGTLLDHTMAGWATTNQDGGHGRANLPVILCGGSGLGIKHQGHVVKKDVCIGDAWGTMVDRIAKPDRGGLVKMPMPKDFQGGQITKGVITDVL